MSHIAKQLNVNPIAPYIVYAESAGNGLVHKVRGPGANEDQAFQSYEAAVQEAQRLLGQS